MRTRARACMQPPRCTSTRARAGTPTHAPKGARARTRAGTPMRAHVCARSRARRRAPTRVRALTLVQAWGGVPAGGSGVAVPFPSLWGCPLPPIAPPTPCHARSTSALCHRTPGWGDTHTGGVHGGDAVPRNGWAQDLGGVYPLRGTGTNRGISQERWAWGGQTGQAPPQSPSRCRVGEQAGGTVRVSSYSRRCRRGCGAGAPDSGSGRRSSGWTGRHPAPPCS